jgi:hypothetical protein
VPQRWDKLQGPDGRSSSGSLSGILDPTGDKCGPTTHTDS